MEQNVHTKDNVYEVIAYLIHLTLESERLKSDIYGDCKTIPHRYDEDHDVPAHLELAVMLDD